MYPAALKPLFGPQVRKNTARSQGIRMIKVQDDNRQEKTTNKVKNDECEQTNLTGPFPKESAYLTLIL
jgi:hypothetical protein